MCLAVPGKIVSIDESDPELKMAKVKFGETVKDICIQWIDDVKVGDFVMAHVGTALTKVDEVREAHVVYTWKEEKCK